MILIRNFAATGLQDRISPYFSKKNILCSRYQSRTQSGIEVRGPAFEFLGPIEKQIAILWGGIPREWNGCF